MQLKLSAAALAAALLLAGCSSEPKLFAPNIVTYESTLDRVHVRDASSAEYYSTRAGAAIRQGEEYEQVLWNEHEEGETDPDKLAHYYGQETKQERLIRLAKERQAQKAAVKAQKNAKIKTRHPKDRSIYGEDYDQSVYQRHQKKAKGTSAAKRFVEKTTLQKNESMKQAVQNAPTVPLDEMPNQMNVVVPAKATAPALQTQAPVTAPAVAPVTTPSVAPAKEAVKDAVKAEADKVAPKAEEAVKAEVKSVEAKVDKAGEVAAEAVKTSDPVKAANDLAEKAKAESAKAEPVVMKHVIDPVVKNAQVNPTAAATPSAPALPPEPTIAPRTAEGTAGVTSLVHSDGEPAPGAVPVPKVGNPLPRE